MTRTASKRGGTRTLLIARAGWTLGKLATDRRFL